MTDDDRYRRIPSAAGFRDPSKLPRGPNGRALCRGCREEVPKGRVSWCSDECVEIHKLACQPAYQARKVLERDHGVCEICHLDCLALLEELRDLARRDNVAGMVLDRRAYYYCRRDRSLGDCGHDPCRLAAAGWQYWGKPGPLLGPRIEPLRLPPSYRRLNRRLWAVDHRVPVVEGGGSCGLENLRTLCWWCHKRETAALARRRAAARKGAKTAE